MVSMRVITVTYWNEKERMDRGRVGEKRDHGAEEMVKLGLGSGFWGEKKRGKGVYRWRSRSRSRCKFRLKLIGHGNVVSDPSLISSSQLKRCVSFSAIALTPPVTP